MTLQPQSKTLLQGDRLRKRTLSANVRQMRVLVTGGSGFVGNAIVQALLEQGNEVSTLSRHAGHSSETIKKDAVAVRGDIANAASVQNACRGMDAVIHLVGIISESRSVRFENTHVLGTRNVVQAMEASGVRRLVHMSALGTRANAASRYHQTKWAAEEIARNSALDWTILRPSLIYGPGDHFLNLFLRISKFSPFLPVIGPGTARFAPVHIGVVAKAFANALSLPTSYGQNLDLCGPELLTIRQMLQRMLKVANRTRMLVRVPPGLGRFQALLLEVLLGKIANTPPPLNRDQIIMLEEGNTGNGAPANELLGLHHPKFEQALRQSIKRK